MAISTDEMIEFLGIVGEKGFLNPNTVGARLTACRKFIDILDPEQKTVEYLNENLDVVKARFMNLNKDVAGATVDEYSRRVRLVIDDFTEWKSDRGGWERKNAAKQSARASGESEKKTKVDKPKPEIASAKPEPSFTVDPATRTITIPLRNGDATITIPRDFVTADVKRLAWALLPYATNFDPEVSPRETFRQLERTDIHTAQ